MAWAISCASLLLNQELPQFAYKKEAALVGKATIGLPREPELKYWLAFVLTEDKK